MQAHPRAIYISVISLITILILTAYSNTFYSPPALDDLHAFIQEPSVQSEGWSLSKLELMTKTKFGVNRFIPMLTFSWDFWIGQGNIAYFHTTNLIIHVLSFFSMLLLTYLIIKSLKYKDKSENLHWIQWWLPIVVSGIWALHPIQTNAVTYLVQRMASLVALFYVLSVAFYIAARLKHIENNRITWISIIYYSLSLLGFILSFLSKENAATIPASLLITEIWFFQPLLIGRILQWIRRHWVISSICAICVLYLAYDFLTIVISCYQTRHFTMLQRLMTEARIMFWYVSLVLFPLPGRFALEHHIEISTSLINPFSTLFAIIAIVGIFVICWFKRREFPIFTYGLMWFGVTQLVESSFISLELVFEHRMYISSFGIILSFVFLVYDFCHRSFVKYHNISEFRRLCWSAFFILAAVLTLSTYARNSVWSDVVALNQDNASKAPDNPRARANLGAALLTAGRYDEAISEAWIAIEKGRTHYEQYCVAANTIVAAQRMKGDFPKAIEVGEKLLEEKPSELDAAAWPAISQNIGLAQLGGGNLKDAYLRAREALVHNLQLNTPQAQYAYGSIKIFQTVLQEAINTPVDLDGDGFSDPGDQSINAWIAAHLDKIGYRNDAKLLLRETIALDTNDREARKLLETIHEVERLDELQKNRKSFRELYVHNPFSLFNASMAGAFVIQTNHLTGRLNRIGEALVENAVEMRPDSPDAQLLKAWYSFDNGDSESAILAGKQALSLDPEYARAWLGLGYFLAKANRAEEAIEAFKQTLELHPGIQQRPVIQQIITSLENPNGTEEAHDKIHEDKTADSSGQQIQSVSNPS